MITKLEVFGVNSSPEALPLGDGNLAYADQVYIRDIEGLGPVKATINTSALGTGEGEVFTSSSISKRNIVLKMGLNPTAGEFSIEGLRRLLYGYFMPRRQVKLYFERDQAFPCAIEGYVEDLVPNIFSKDPEIQVSIICPQPDFISTSVGSVGGPIEDEIEPIEYNGTLPTPVTLEVTPNGIGTEYYSTLVVTFQDPATKTFALDVAITDDQFFRMSSIPGNKYVELVNYDTGAVTNLLRNLPTDVAWPILVPGLNNFKVLADSVELAWNVKYYPRDGGL